MNVKLAAGLVVAIAVAVLAGVLLMGDDGDQEATDTDGAFVAAMVPHHEGAIEMAEIARSRAEHPEIRRLADDIMASQSTEIEAMESMHERMFDGPLGSVHHGSMGLDEHQMGMAGDAAALENAEPFDRAFIEMMISHHQGAIAMAEIELAGGNDEEARALAEDIIEAQTNEIEQMNRWHSEWYGAGPGGMGGGAPHSQHHGQ